MTPCALLTLLLLCPATRSAAQFSPSAGNWTQFTGSSPSPRSGSSMAYDDATQMVVLFGGSGINGIENETWLWNGITWTQQFPQSSPPARLGATMSFDAATGNLVLFGGRGQTGLLGDTWTYDGITWTQQSPATSPSARSYPMSTYDDGLRAVVLFGGTYPSGNTNGGQSDTWTWNGTNWTQVAIPAVKQPYGVLFASFAYHAAVQDVVMLGGYDLNVEGSGTPIETFQFNGSTWSKTYPIPSPPALYGPSSTYDPASGTVVLFGGTNLSGNDQNDTWSFDGYRWTMLTPAAKPPSRHLAQMVYDKATRSIVLYGGQTASPPLILYADSWTYSLQSPGGISVSADVLTQIAGGPVHVQSTVLPSSGTVPPTGSLTFLIDGKPQPASPLNPVGTAFLTTTTLSPGEHSIGAIYPGDQNYPASSSLYSIEEDVLPPILTATLISGAGQTTKVGTPFANPIVVQVTNSFGNMVAGVPINLNGPGMSTPAVLTNSSGEAVFTSVTPHLFGTLPLIASVGSGKPFVLFTESAQPLPLGGAVNFAPLVNLFTGSSTSGGISPQAAIADFNGEGHIDIATVDLTNASISVLFGNGDGTFQTPVVYPTGVFPYGIVAADFNGDGKPDIAITNDSTDESVDKIQIFLNDGTGHFSATPSSSNQTALLPFGLVTADLNRDGVPDLIVSETGSNAVGILFGNGDGTFTTQPGSAVGRNPYNSALADLNGDGYPDIVAVGFSNNTLSVLLNDGTGGFPFLPQFTYPTPPGPFNLSTGDFNGDGIQDIAVAATNGNVIAVYLGNGGGSFKPYITYPAGASPYSVLAADLNGDGFLDLISANLADGTISVLLGRGDGTFLPQSVFAAGAQPYYLLAADFNNDGNLDLSVSPYEYTTGVLLQKKP